MPTEPGHAGARVARDDWTPADGWTIALAAARQAEAAAALGVRACFRLAGDSTLADVPADHPGAVVAWVPGHGWAPTVASDDPRHPLLDLYLPVCSATCASPITVGHLGQSLDGFIATHSGDSQFVTGQENIVHLHRMRALSDAVVVGAGTVAADDPQLTTRLVAGPSPLRVVLDPMRRLGEHYRLFNDDSAETLYVCARSEVRAGETAFGRAHLVGIEDRDGSVDITAVLALLRARGCHRIFVEGGGVTVSAFLESGLLDRLHMAIAPLIIGNGRPAIRLPPRTALSDCSRPRYRVFRMGGDVLFDCDLRAEVDEAEGGRPGATGITRVI